MIRAESISKVFEEGDKRLSILNGLELSLAEKKKIGIVGASGAGKSTLLHILGGLDVPTHGKIFVQGDDLYRLKEDQRSDLRNRYFGFVFQFYHLLPELTVLENVLLPVLISGKKLPEAKQLAMEVLNQVGLGERCNQRATKLSGGEQQRVALARACVGKPKLILADEPTGNLDEKTGLEVLNYLLDVVQKSEGSLVMVTHNRDLLRQFDQVYELKNGKLFQI